EIAAELGRRFPGAWARAEIGWRRRIAVDGSEPRAEASGIGAVLVGAPGARGWIEVGTSDASREAVAELAAELAARGAGGEADVAPAAGVGGGASGPAQPPTARPPVAPAIEPRTAPAALWLERAAALHERAVALGESRIVYRAVFLEVDDRDVIWAGGGRDVAERRLRARAGALLLASNGRTLVAEEAERGGALGLEVSELDDGALSRAAEGALALLTGPDVPAGERTLLMTPSVAALVVRHGLARGLEGDGWTGGGARAAALVGSSVAPAHLTVADEPTAAGAFGGHGVDDEGWTAAPAPLIEGGVLRGPLTDAGAAAALDLPRTGHGRRSAPLAPARPRPAHLVVAPGEATRDGLLAGIEDGLLIEGGVSGAAGGAAWASAARAGRAGGSAG